MNEFDVYDMAYDNTVQMAVEMGLLRLSPSPLRMYTGVLSRTDSGVHALDTYMFAGLLHPDDPDNSYKSEEIEETINQYLLDNKHAISIKRVFPVPWSITIKGRAIEFREYTYRFIYQDVRKHEADVILSPYDRNRIAVIRVPAAKHSLDLNLMQQALKRMEGEQDMRSFEAEDKGYAKFSYAYRQNANRTIDRICLNKVSLRTGSFFDYLYEDRNCYEIRIRSRGFLYRQVRRMVGASVMVACGLIDMERLNFMLEHGHNWNWLDHYVTAPAEGLYLSQMKFSDQNNWMQHSESEDDNEEGDVSDQESDPVPMNIQFP